MSKELWLIWKDPNARQRYKIGSLKQLSDSHYTFSYTNPDLDDAIQAGFRVFFGFDNLTKEYTSTQLFANIASRLPNPARPDYLAILNRYNLSEHSSDFEILRATRGRLLTDTYEFVAAYDPNKIEFDIAGTQHSPNIEEWKQLIRIDDSLILQPEPDNKYDSNAIKVLWRRADKQFELGYVPRYYTKDLTKILKTGTPYSAMIQSLNPDSQYPDENVTAFVKLIFAQTQN